MAANIQRNYSRRKNKQLVSEINITPMVDVMLVLLIIFMITAPMLVAGIKIDLPETKSAPLSEDSKPLVITIDKEGKIFLFDDMINKNSLVNRLKNTTKENLNARIFLKGDKNVPYGVIVDIMADITNAGFTKVALISNIKQQK